MLRELTTILSLTLTGAIIASACSSGEQCGDCCDACSGGNCGTVGDCSTSGVMPHDAGPTCTEDPKPRVVCTPGSSQPCQSPATSQAPASCLAGQQTCNATGTGFSVCDDVLPHPDECDEASYWLCDDNPPACGSATWATALAGGGDEAVRSIAVDSFGNSVIAVSAGGGDVTVGTTTVSFASPGQLVAKLDRDGVPRWAIALVNATSAAVTIDATGAVYVTGTSAGALQIAGQAVPTGSSNGAYLAKMSPGGVVVWTRSLEEPRREDAPATSFSPAALTIAAGAPVIAGTYSGDVLLLNNAVISRSVGQDGFIARYDSTTGNALWVTPISDAADDTLSTIAGNDAGEVVVGGYSDGTADCPTPHVLYLRLDDGGGIEWIQRPVIPARITSIQFNDYLIAAAGVAARSTKVGTTFVDAPGFVFAAGGTDIDWYVPTTFQGEGVVINGAGDVIAAGTTPGGGAAIAKFDLVGDRFYEHVYAANPNSGAASASIAFHALGTAPDDGVLVAGGILGRSDLALGFGGVPVASTAGGDAFLARLAP